ncbi:MAG: hypothetical protein R3343_00075 [Nitriliruptorales bacterium]|nr:hypothetical protein [Nitriliruptorales bacterium]
MAERVTIVWVHGGGCDGCTMSVLGATSPRLEELVSGRLTRSEISVVHPHLVVEAGDAYVAALDAARHGQSDPYVLVVEGSMFDEALAGAGTFSRLGQRDGVPVTVEQWVSDLAPGAAAVVAIGTCATWGGIPAARGNVTGAGGVDQVLGADYESATGLPIVNVPGCAPSGDAFLETIHYLLLHFEGAVPFDMDELGRPRWLYADETPLRRPRLPGIAREPDDELTAACPVPQRGWINRLGGCASVGGDCNGCTRPDFPDRTLPLVAVTRD